MGTTAFTSVKTTQFGAKTVQTVVKLQIYSGLKWLGGCYLLCYMLYHIYRWDTREYIIGENAYICSFTTKEVNQYMRQTTELDFILLA